MGSSTPDQDIVSIEINIDYEKTFIQQLNKDQA